MPTDNDAQARALVEALAPMIAAAIIPQLTASVEAQVKGIKAKNDELLDKLANVKKDDEIAAQIKAGDDLAAKTKALLEGTVPKTDKGLVDFRKVGEPLRISRADARDVAAYKKAKALAAEQGVPLEIVAD
jgi:hypothetical protein